MDNNQNPFAFLSTNSGSDSPKQATGGGDFAYLQAADKAIRMGSIGAGELGSLAKEEGADHLMPVINAIYGQESGAGANGKTSTDGARGGMQIMPDTFRRFAKQGESIDNAADNMRVGMRIIKTLGDKFGNDPAKIATGYFSGEGNVNSGNGSAWKNDHKDGNGKSVSGYVSDVLGRLSPVKEAKADDNLPDLSQIPKWSQISTSERYVSLPDVEKTKLKSAYFDDVLAPYAGAEAGKAREAFMAQRDTAPSFSEKVDTKMAGIVPAVKELFGMDKTPDAASVMEGYKPGAAPSGVANLQDTMATSKTLRDVDGSVENRRARLVSQGEAPEFADRAAREAAAAGIAPGAEIAFMQKQHGTIGKSDFDFETSDLFKNQTGLNNPLVRGAAKAGLGTTKALSGYTQFMGDVLGIDGMQAAGKDAGTWARGKEGAIGEKGNFLERNLEGAINSIGQQLPLMITGVKLESEALPLAGMAMQTFGQEYSDGRSVGQTPVEATERAAIFAAFEVVGEKFGLHDSMQAIKAAAKGLPNKEVLGFLWSALKKEVPGELLTTTGQFGADKLPTIGLNQQATGEDFLKQVADTVAQTVMQSGVMAGGTTGVSTAVRYMRDKSGNATVEAIHAEDTRNKVMDRWNQGLLGVPREAVQSVQTPDGRLEPTATSTASPTSTPNVAAAEPTPIDVHPTSAVADSIVAELANQHGIPHEFVLPQQKNTLPAAEGWEDIADQDVLDFAETRYRQLVNKLHGSTAQVATDAGMIDQEVPAQPLTPSERAELDVLESQNPAEIRSFYGMNRQMPSDQTANQNFAQTPAPTVAPVEQPDQGTVVPEATEPGLVAAQENQNAQTIPQAAPTGSTPSQAAIEPTEQPSGSTQEPQPANGSASAQANPGNPVGIADQQVQPDPTLTFDVSGRNDQQLSVLATNGQPGWKEAAQAELAKRGIGQVAATPTATPTATPQGQFKTADEAQAYIHAQRRRAGERLPKALPLPHADGSFGVVTQGQAEWETAVEHQLANKPKTEKQAKAKRAMQQESKQKASNDDSLKAAREWWSVHRPVDRKALLLEKYSQQIAETNSEIPWLGLGSGMQTRIAELYDARQVQPWNGKSKTEQDAKIRQKAEEIHAAANNKLGGTFKLSVEQVETLIHQKGMDVAEQTLKGLLDTPKKPKTEKEAKAKRASVNALDKKSDKFWKGETFREIAGKLAKSADVYLKSEPVYAGNTLGGEPISYDYYMTDGRRSQKIAKEVHDFINQHIADTKEQSNGTKATETPLSTVQEEARQGQTLPESVSKYTAPEDVHGDWLGSQRSDFKPNARQQMLMDSVQKALDAGAFYNDAVQDKVAKDLGVTQVQLASNKTNVQGGDFGYDVYHARKALDAAKNHALEKQIREELNLKEGDKLGTLVFNNDFKVNTNVVVKSVSEDGNSVELDGKRGAYTVTVSTNPAAVRYSIERAKERGKRKDTYEEFLAGRNKPKTEKEAKAKRSASTAAPREMTDEGRAKDGQPINGGDVFLTSSGRSTTPYPKQKQEKYASQWLIDNAVAEAESRGDSFNAAPFKATNPGKNGSLIMADREGMLMYLFGEQPNVVPSITKPLVAKTEQAPAEKSPKAVKTEKSVKADKVKAQLEDHFAPGNIIYNSYWKTHDRVLAFSWNDGNWNVQVEEVKQKDGEWVKTGDKRFHSTRPDAKDMVVDRAPAVQDTSVEHTPDNVQNFGKELEGGRRNRAPSLDKDLTEDDIAKQPLSKIWPADEIDGIEDKFAAAVAFTARAEIPAKPRVSYRVANWAQKVQVLRQLAAGIVRVGNEKARELFMKSTGSAMAHFRAKVDLLEAIDRGQWSRIGDVRAYPNAYSYLEDGTKVPASSVNIEIDGKNYRFSDAKAVTEEAILNKVNELLGTEAEDKKMAFEVRGRAGSVFINKKGDKEYRKLKTFTDSKEAFAYIKEHHAELVAAWDAVKARDNVGKGDVRSAENRPRTGKDWLEGKDVTAQQFIDDLGFRGVEFGKWVGQGNGAKERQGMLNQAYEALMDLATIIGVPPKAISLNGSMGLAFGSRGSGNASAHFEPGNLVINLTKTKGAGTLAHEWFHALDNYFARMRGGEKTMKELGSQGEYRRQNFVTYKPEPLMVHKVQRSTPLTKARLEQYHKENPKSQYFNPENWEVDPKHPAGVRPVVEKAFADLVEALDKSPMTLRAKMNDKGTDGYWGRIIERAARSFENYVIHKMGQDGYQNDYLANVVPIEDFQRNDGRYPYLLKEEVKPVADAFDTLFKTVETKQTDDGHVTMFSRSKAKAPNQWYQSQLETAIDQAPHRIFGKAAQFKLWLASNAAKLGIKKEEIEWSGINDYLDLQQSVSKQDLLEFLSNNGVKVQDVMKGEIAGDKIPDGWQLVPDDAENPQSWELRDQNGVLMGEGWTQQDAIDNARDDDEATSDTKYSAYTLPGGTNYKELLLTLPSQKATGVKSVTSDGENWKVEFADGRVETFSERKANDKQEALDYVMRDKNYKSAHWDESNILAHVRFNDRTDADGNKVLFIEELQSDWAQAGRKRGFKSDAEQRFKIEKAKLVEKYGDGKFRLKAEKSELEAMDQAYAEWQKEQHETLLVPTAPFVKDTKAWVSLAIKRMVAYAAENGYDKVAFVNGDQSAERYDLSKQIDKVEYTEGGALYAWDKSGAEVMRKKMPESEVEDHIGKDLAVRLLSAEKGKYNSRSLSGADIKVGGEGMKSFYDKIVPQVANDVLKKLGGGKLYETEFSLDPNVELDQWIPEDGEGDGSKAPVSTSNNLSFVITDAMREQVAKGLPLFSRNKSGSGMAVRDLEAVAERARESLKNLPKVHVLESPSDLNMSNPSQSRLARYIEDQGAGNDVEAATHEGEIYMFASNLSDEFRAEHVLVNHEVGHYGLRAVFGKEADQILNTIYMTNSGVRKAADALRKRLDLASNVEATEEVLVEMAPNELIKLNAWRRLVRHIRNWLDSHGFNKMAERLGGLLKAGMSDQQKADLMVADVVNAARDWVRNGKSGQQATVVDTKLSADQVKTEKFKRWFGGSKTVDAQGKPIIFYRGQGSGFNDSRLDNRYFTSDPKYASTYDLDEGMNILPVYIKAENIITPDDINRVTDYDFDKDALLNQGYDAIASKDLRIIVALKGPEQIKSASGNNGDFDGSKSDIRFSQSDKAYNSQDDGIYPTTSADSGRAVDALNRLFERHRGVQSAFQGVNSERLIEVAPLATRFGAKVVGVRPRTSLTDDQRGKVAFFNGLYYANRIFLSTQTDRPHLAVLGHELVHRMRNTNPALYVELADAIRPYIEKKHYDDNWKNEPAARGIDDPHKLTEEFLSEVMSDGFMDKDFWRSVGEHNPSLLMRVYDMVSKLIERALSGTGYTKRTEDYLTDYKKVMEIAGQVMAEFERNPGKDNPDRMPKFSRKPIGEVFRDLQSNVVQFYGNQDLKTFNGVNRTINTQYHKALKDKDFGRVYNLIQGMQNHVATASSRPAELAPGILHRVDNVIGAVKTLVSKSQRKSIEQAGEALFAGTLAGKNVTEGKVWTEQELRAQFGMDDTGVALYKQARAAIDASLDELAAAEAYALAENYLPKAIRNDIIESPEDAASLIVAALDRQIDVARRANLDEASQASMADAKDKVKAIFDQADKLKKAGYAPLMRFGKYDLKVQAIDQATGNVQRDEEGNPVTLFYSRYETQAQARTAEAEQKALYADKQDVRIQAGVVNESANELYRGVSPETLSVFADAVGARQAMDDYIRLVRSERSAMKRQLGRKGTQGYTKDVQRVLANFITSNARQAAQQLYGTSINQSIRRIPKEKGDVQKEALDLRDYVINPNDNGALGSSLMFAWFLGGSPASALVNMTQPVMMTLPFLSQYGAARAATELTKAIPYAMGSKQITDNDLRHAMKKASLEGIVDAQEVFHLYAIGSRQLSAGPRSQALMTLWGSMFSAVEGMNRRLTFIAAWNMANAKGMADPYDFAVNAVNQTQGIYNKANRPNAARSTVGRAVFTFKTYSIMYTELMHRMWNSGSEGKKAVLLMMAVLILAAGIEGLPGAKALDDLIDTIGQWMGYDTNMKRWKRRHAYELLGKVAGDLVLYGASSLTPLDFGGRLGLGNMIPATDILKPSNGLGNYAKSIGELVGPTAGAAQQIGDAAVAMEEGNYGKAVTNLMPKAGRDFVSSISMGRKGYATDAAGRKTVETTGTDAVIKGIGFNPTVIANKTRAAMPLQQDIQLAKKKEASIVHAWAQAVVDGDQKAAQDQAKRLTEWNLDNPDTPIRISPSQIRDKAKVLSTDKGSRITKTAPKEMRGRIGLELLK